MYSYFFKNYRSRTILVLIALFVAASLEGLSITAILPLLAGIIARQTSSNIELGASEEVATSLSKINEWFDVIGGLPSTSTLVIGISLAVLAKSFIIYYARIYAGYTATKIAKDLRLHLLRAIGKVDWNYYISHSSGKISNSLMQEVQQASHGYTIVTQLSSCLIQMVVYATIALFLSWQMSLIVFLLGGVLIFALNRLVRAGKKIGTENTTLARALLTQLNDNLRNIKSLKAMACTQRAEGLMIQNTKKMAQVQKHLAHIQAAVTSAQDPILAVCMLLGIYVSLFLFHMPIEALLVIMFALTRMLKTSGRAQKLYQEYLIMSGGFHGIMESINTAEKHRETISGGVSVPNWQSIRFQDISFSHGKTLVLENCSFTLNRNQLISIVGPSGTGKTTVIDLLARLYQPTSGNIFIDQIPFSDLDVKQWRSELGYVTQEVSLLHTSIFQNITLGDTSISEDKVISILKDIYAWNFIKSLPKGIFTEVGVQGAKLSGGQRQRILIARALARNPKLLIVDEATSALDENTENLIAELFKRLSKSITIISISHRPAIVNLSDKVYTLDKGKLIEKTQEVVEASTP